MTDADIRRADAVPDDARDDAPPSHRLRITLAPYQSRAVEALAVGIARTHALIARSPADRAQIARQRGTHLLVAPTGSGKTLILGRALETLVPEPIVPASGFKGSVWFWFAPYSGLVEQTRLALRAECSGLRLRDLSMDREPSWTRDGDTFVHTWGSVAANNREARRLRRSGESALSVDDMIATLRDDGFFIGCVIDEAHLNFGTGARAAAEFYLQHLRPDVTILSTATPSDAKLAAFSRAAGLGEPHRVEISRAEAVAARLMKPGLIAAHLVLTGEQRMALDPDETIVRAAWQRHRRVKERLQSHGLGVTPLLLVQVPNDSAGDAKEVDRAKTALFAAGAPEDAIRVHTSGQPDPEFRALANDEDVEALIFKLSAATGFDAPRAFSLVSLRPVISPDFGIQVVGRVMRVDRRIRASEAALADPILSRGTIFLSDRDRQGGVDAAVGILGALRTSIEAVAPQLSLAVFGSGMQEDGAHFAGAERTVDLLEVSGCDRETVESRSADAIDDVVRELEEDAARSDAAQFEIFPGLLPSDGAGRPEAAPRPGQAAYARRDDLRLPVRLSRERAPKLAELPKLAEEAASVFAIDTDVLALLVRPETINVELRMRELLLGDAERSERLLPCRRRRSSRRRHSLPLPSRTTSTRACSVVASSDALRRRLRAPVALSGRKPSSGVSSTRLRCFSAYGSRMRSHRR